MDATQGIPVHVHDSGICTTVGVNEFYSETILHQQAKRNTTRKAVETLLQTMVIIIIELTSIGQCCELHEQL